MQDKWLEQLSKFERVIVNCSEGMGEMNDYLRPSSGIVFGKTLTS